MNRISENKGTAKEFPQVRDSQDDVFNQDFRQEKSRHGANTVSQGSEVSRSSAVQTQSEPSVSEITYDFKVDAVPPGFTGDSIARQSMSEEEEEITIIEEEIVFTGPSALIQSYKDNAKKEEEWQKSLEESMGDRMAVPGSTVPNWDTSAKPEPREDSIVHAKMVMVEPEREAETRTPPEEERSRSSTTESELSGHAEVEVPRPPSPVMVDSEEGHEKTVVNGYDDNEVKRSTILRYVRSEEDRARARRQPKETGEKEEFVFSKDDLNKIDFLGGRKPKKPAFRPPVSLAAPVVKSSVVSTHTAPVVEKRSNSTAHRHSLGVAKPSKHFMAPQPYRQPSGGSERREYSLHRSSADESSRERQSGSLTAGSNKANIRSDMNFPPRTESEAENVLEEKSISMIALPAMRVSSSSSDGQITSMSSSEAKGSRMAKSDSPPSSFSTHNPTNLASQSPSNHASPVAVPPSQSGATAEQQELVNAQYDQLQSQFALWQQQLMQNQALLAQHKIMPEDQNQQLQQLQLQLQLQQQMMEQLQQSMQALAMQGARVAPPPATQTVQVVNSAPPPAPVVPQPPAAPPAPSTPVVPKTEQTTSSKPKNKKRFERQLDPREELMLAIRQAAGRNCLKKVIIVIVKSVDSSSIVIL